MSQESIDHEYMKVQRSVWSLESQIAAMRSQINESGRMLRQIADGLMAGEPEWNVDRPTVELAVSKVWNLTDKFAQAEVELAEKRDELGRYNPSASV